MEFYIVLSFTNLTAFIFFYFVFTLANMLTLDFAGISISVFFIFFILSKKIKKRTDFLLLIIYVNVIGILIVDAIFQRSLTNWILFLLHVLPLYALPLFLLYALEILQKTIHHKWRWLILFLPSFLGSVYLALDLFYLRSYSKSELLDLYNNPTVPYHLITKVFPIVYVAALIILIRKLSVYSTRIKEEFSYIDPIKLNWLTVSSWIYFLMTVLSVLGFVVSQFKILPISSHTVCNLIGVFLFLAIFYVSFHGIKQYAVSDFYNQTTFLKQDLTASKVPKFSIDPDTKISPQSSFDQKQVYDRLIMLFEQKKLYLEPRLQISDVALAMGVPSHVLSQVINGRASMPFYNFVNNYRVRHLQDLLENPSNYKFTILALGLESGFNSKASINRVFRDETGSTPSEYQKRHLSK